MRIIERSTLRSWDQFRYWQQDAPAVVYVGLGTGFELLVYRRLVRSLSLAVAAAGLLACESTNSPVPVPVYEHHVTAEMVTGAALAALRADGRFNVEIPATSAGQLSLQEATAQTLQFALFVTNNSNLRAAASRGGFWADPHLLTICADPAHYVHSQLGVIPRDSIPAEGHEFFRQRFGPLWLISLCGSANEPQMVVRAAIDGNSIRFVNGEPAEEYPGVTTAWFPRGVPLNWPDALPISRERAVRFAFETFGVRASEVPELLFRGDIMADGHYDWFLISSALSCNRWRVVLESDVAIRGATSFATVNSDTVYVGSGSCHSPDVNTPYIHLPRADQPATVRLDYYPWSVQAPVVSPIRFEIGFRVP